MVAQNKKLVLRLYSRSVPEVFVLVDCIPCCFMFWCPIVVFINFSRYFFIKPPVRPGSVLRNPFLITLGRIVFVRHEIIFPIMVWLSGP